MAASDPADDEVVNPLEDVSPEPVELRMARIVRMGKSNKSSRFHAQTRIPTLSRGREETAAKRVLQIVRINSRASEAGGSQFRGRTCSGDVSRT